MINTYTKKERSRVYLVQIKKMTILDLEKLSILIGKSVSISYNKKYKGYGYSCLNGTYMEGDYIGVKDGLPIVVKEHEFKLLYKSIKD